MTDPAGPLFTDLYQLTMLAGYLRHDLHGREATFDLYFRRAPFKGTYAVWAGLENAVEHLQNLRFTATHLAYLRSLGLFDEAFLTYLRGWRFRATATAFPEGSVVFANEPLLSVTGAPGEAQLVETALLNIVNFQALVATKAARRGQLRLARRLCRGASGTSNVEAGALYGLPVVGTHAHASVETFSGELDAFRAYAGVFPDSVSLLLDTFDTLRSGLPHAVEVARELRSRGKKLSSVRLDSGDLACLSREVRESLDAAGFGEVKIIASNDLDEFVISEIVREAGGWTCTGSAPGW